jgi:hypothetical protein
MTLTTLTDDQVYEALIRACEEKGFDHIYQQIVTEAFSSPGCFYATTDGEASCLVGHVLRQNLTDSEWESFYGFNSAPASSLFGEVAFIATSRLIRRVLIDIQTAQDHGVSWGQACSLFAFDHTAPQKWRDEFLARQAAWQARIDHETQAQAEAEIDQTLRAIELLNPSPIFPTVTNILTMNSNALRELVEV